MFNGRLQRLLFGASFNSYIEPRDHKTFTIVFTPGSEEDVKRRVMIPSADGIMLYLVKRIEKLEKKINQLEVKAKK